jgi:hypothetical protein
MSSSVITWVRVLELYVWLARTVPFGYAIVQMYWLFIATLHASPQLDGAVQRNVMVVLAMLAPLDGQVSATADGGVCWQTVQEVVDEYDEVRSPLMLATCDCQVPADTQGTACEVISPTRMVFQLWPDLRY